MTFSADLVGRLQGNQRSRYMDVMEALNMSAALTARKTKEFRSPPQEQVTGQKSSVKEHGQRFGFNNILASTTSVSVTILKKWLVIGSVLTEYCPAPSDEHAAKLPGEEAGLPLP